MKNISGEWTNRWAYNNERAKAVRKQAEEWSDKDLTNKQLLDLFDTMPKPNLAAFGLILSEAYAEARIKVFNAILRRMGK